MAKKIAVAGGTGGLGRTIVDALVTAGDHEVLVLSRKVLRKNSPLPNNVAMMLMSSPEWSVTKQDRALYLPYRPDGLQ